MASLKQKAKVLLRSRSLAFTRDYFRRDAAVEPRTYGWHGLPVHYRSGTTDANLIYSILLKEANSEYAPPPQARLDPAEVRVVLDIGANIGIAALYFARLFPNAEVHAFEPDPGNCEVLRANAAAVPRIKVHPFALGAEDGELELYDSDDRMNRGGYSGFAMGIDASRSKKVPLRHAGRALSGLGLSRADVIKIDTEGAEWEILTSMEPQLLKSARLVMGELHGRRDFELLGFLQPTFHIGAKKQLHSRLFNFFAVNREIG